MAQSGFTPVQLYRSTTASAVPLAADLAAGELAINIADMKLYAENASGVVTLLATAAGASGDVVGPASATGNNLAAFDGITGKLIKQAATVTVAQGGTGVTTSTGTTNVVLSNSPTLVTPVLGVAIATSLQSIIGNVTPAAATVTTLTTSSTVTHNAGTANGVAFLNGSKVLTTGSALTFDGTNLGLGTASPSGTAGTTFAINGGAGQTRLALKNNGSGDASGDGFQIALLSEGSSVIYQNRESGGYQAWEIGGSERMRLDSSGNLLVGTTSSNPISSQVNGLSIRGAVGDIFASAQDTPVLQLARRGSDGGVIQFYKNTTAVGSVSTTSVLTTYNTTSDYRLKTVIGPVTNAGQRIDALQPVAYTWNASGEHTRGFLAHQFQEVYAGSVSGAKDAVDAEGKPVYQAMQASTSEVIADLVAELQALRARVASLESSTLQ